MLVRYIRAYIEATQWVFNVNNRVFALELLTRHNGLEARAAEETLDALLDPVYGIYPKAELNLLGLKAVLDLRAEMGLSHAAAAVSGQVHRPFILRPSQYVKIFWIVLLIIVMSGCASVVSNSERFYQDHPRGRINWREYLTD